MDDSDQPSAAASATDLDELVRRLRARVEQRRQDGTYPPDLETQLDAHFERITAHRPAPFDYSTLQDRLHALDEAMGFSPTRIDYGSGVPGGAALHKAVAKAVSRQTAGVLEQMHRFSEAVRAVLDEMVVALQHPNGHVHSELLGQVDALMESVADFERLPSDAVAGVGDLRRRLERLEASEAARQFRPWFRSADFEEQFRGTRAELLDRYVDLAQRFVGFEPVVDLGCGRGEFLELLAKAGVESLGVDIDAELVRAAGQLGFRVEHADAVAWLAATHDASLGGISLIQVIEHLTPQQRTEVIRLAGEKLRPGGKLLIETLNPQSLYVLANPFYADPTHHSPVHPALVEFLLREAEFREISIEWRSPPPVEEFLETVDGEGRMVELFNANVGRVNRLLFGPQDYAVIAVR